MSESTRAALNRFSERQAREVDPSRERRKNEQPEREFKKVFCRWLTESKWTFNVVESKAVYNFESGRYDHGQTDAGFSDIVAVTPYRGVAAYIELKAPGNRRGLRVHQRDFLTEKIKAGAFGVCVDSTIYMAKTYAKWFHLRAAGQYDQSIQFLLSELPVVRSRVDRFDELLSENR